MIVLLHLILFTSFCLFLKWRWEENQILRKLNWLPRLPGGYPVLGNSLQLHKKPKEYLSLFHKFTRESKNGSVVIPTIKNIGIYTIDYDLFEFVLSSNQLVTKADEYRYFFRWLGTGVITSSGDKWKTRRRLLMPTFHNAVLETYIETMDNNAKQFVKKLEPEVGKSSFDIFPYVNLCTLNVICETIMGVSINDPNLILKESAYLHHIEKACNIAFTRPFSLYKSNDMIFPFTEDYKSETEILSTLHAFTNSVIHRKREQFLKEKEKSESFNGDLEPKKRKIAFLDFLLQLELDGKPLPEEEIREQVDTFMFAGHDTTGSGISFALYSLSRHPEIQQKAYEQRKIFGDDKNRPITSKDLQDMIYLDCIVKETLRLYPSVPFIARKIVQDTKYKGNIIPKGVFVLLFIYGIQRSANFFKDPDKFVPERFETFDPKNQYAYVPFSAGPRSCMGKKFSYWEMKCVLARVIQNYILLPPNPDKDVDLMSQTVIKSLTGVHCGLEKRQWI